MKSSVNAYLEKIERLHCEILAALSRRDSSSSTSPADFAGRFFELDDWQRRILTSSSPRIILNCCRQAGKSTVVALMALHRALYYPRSLVLIVSPSLRQSSELFRRVMGFYSVIENVPPPERESALRAEFSNGSRILSLPGQESTIRGYSSVDLLIADEAARIPDELYYSVRPMLAVSRGRLVLLSTPFGKRGFFYEIWTTGEGWEKIMITADDCPRISKEFLREEESSMPRSWFLQEYYCQFVDTEDQVFSSDEIEAMFDDSTPYIEI